MPERRSRAISGTVDPNIVEKIIDPLYLAIVEREHLYRAGLSIRAIAAVMQRAPSTISRELQRTPSRRAAISRTRPTAFP